MELKTTWFGVFLIHEGKIVDKILFPPEVDEIARRLKKIAAGGVLDEEQKLVKGKHVYVHEERLRKLGTLGEDRSPPILPADFGYTNELLQQATIRMGMEDMQKMSEDFDLIQEVRAADDLLQMCNLVSERVREWFALRYPGLDAHMEIEDLYELITTMDNCPHSLRTLAHLALDLHAQRENMEKSITGRMKSIAPNLALLIGPIIGARLIASAGGIKRLSRLPASTIQVLGAEKSLFKHIKDGTPPPKHGILFQHPYVHSAPPWQRGKIARCFAGKVSIAARVDATSKRLIHNELKEDLERRIKEIRRTHTKKKRRTKR